MAYIKRLKLVTPLKGIYKEYIYFFLPHGCTSLFLVIYWVNNQLEDSPGKSEGPRYLLAKNLV